jgi:hypothetical protein
VETPATCSALLGAPVLLLVAEPWDYTSAYGRGRLQGHISNIRDFGPVGGQELVITVAPFMAEGRAIDSLLATPLHPGSGNMVQYLLERLPCAVRAVDTAGGPFRLAAAIRRLGPGRPSSAPG